MSHVVTIKSSFKNLEVLKRVCDKRQIPIELAAKGKTLTRSLYSGNKVEGVAALQLEDWQYPVVVQEDGQAKLDNFGGRWGDQKRLDEVTQDYSKELVTGHYRQQGFRVQQEQVEQDGTMVLHLVS